MPTTTSTAARAATTSSRPPYTWPPRSPCATRCCRPCARLAAAIGAKAGEVGDQVKAGRTHLMDALPVTVGQEMTAWQSQVDGCDRAHRRDIAPGCTGSHSARPRSAPASTRIRSSRRAAIARLGARTGIAFTGAPDRFASLAAQDTSVELSGTLRGAAVVLLKVANDLRWMNSGPLAGLAEISLPALAAGFEHHARQGQPGDPGSGRDGRHDGHGARRVGRHGGRIGQFPAERHAAAHRRCARSRASACSPTRRLRSPSASFPGITVNAARISESLARNPMLLTALAPRIGYDRAAAIAKRAAAESRPILDIAVGGDRASARRARPPARSRHVSRAVDGSGS